MPITSAARLWRLLRAKRAGPGVPPGSTRRLRPNMRPFRTPSIAAFAMVLLVPGIVAAAMPTGDASRYDDPRAARAAEAKAYYRPWGKVEDYYLKLLNCTRTGGWVQWDGRCTGYGSGDYSPYVAPVKMDLTLAGKVARPYAKKLAVGNACTHSYQGNDFGERMRAQGYHSWAGENLGCRTGDPYKAVLASHRYFQNEKDENGGHWKNIKNTRWKTVGIGVWVYSGRVRLVTDLYQP